MVCSSRYFKHAFLVFDSELACLIHLHIIQISHPPTLCPSTPAAARRDLLEALSTFFTVKINELVGEGEQSSKQMQDLQLTKQQYFVTTKIRAQILLQHNKDTKTPAQLQEDIGSALTTLLRKEDLLVHLLATPMTPQSAYDPRKDDRKGDQYKSGLAVMQLTAEDQGSQGMFVMCYILRVHIHALPLCSTLFY